MSERHPYGRLDYVAALAAGMGWSPLEVGEWSTGMAVRPIAGDARDVTGPYPRTPLAHGAALADGLERLRGLGLVSVVLVPDPLFSPPPAQLEQAFAVCRPFKRHLLIERAKGYAPSKHHRDRIRRGHRRCQVRRVILRDSLGDWRSLYAELVTRHAIDGVADFGETYFAALAEMDDFIAFAAHVDGELAGMTIWFEHAGVAVSHLTAANALGYANGANYALNDAAFAHFGQAAVIDLGGAAGAKDDPSDGLFQFKQGFANSAGVAYLCGAVLDPARYATLAGDIGHSEFFPAYRARPASSRTSPAIRDMSSTP